MENKKIVVFVYDFPHRKSLTGLQIIKNSIHENIYVVSQPYTELKFRKSKNRKEVFEKEILNPTDISKAYGWETFVNIHNSAEALNFYESIKPDYGIILGARILSRDVIDSFSKGIFNFHRGLLPHNRGLDTIKWAIYNNIPQGVTTHLIDEKIDVGMKVYLDIINIDKDDTIFDVDSKLFYLEMEHLNKILSEDFNHDKPKSLQSEFKSQEAVSDDIDKKVFKDFEIYKKNYLEILDNYNPEDF